MQKIQIFTQRSLYMQFNVLIKYKFIIFKIFFYEHFFQSQTKNTKNCLKISRITRKFLCLSNKMEDYCSKFFVVDNEKKIEFITHIFYYADSTFLSDKVKKFLSFLHCCSWFEADRQLRFERFSFHDAAYCILFSPDFCSVTESPSKLSLLLKRFIKIFI